MSHVTLKASLKLHSNLLKIKDDTTLAQTLKQIRVKTPDYIILEKPNASQMTAVLISRLAGKNFVWIQGFGNPPTPNILTKLLLTQADRIVAKNKKDIRKLIDLGIKKSKIKLQR